MKLQVPTLADCEIVRLWRNECLETLRTPHPLTAEMQEAFYRDVICNRNSPHRYWSIYDVVRRLQKDVDALVGFGGMTNIEWENRQAEISLIIYPALQGQGYGKKAVELLLDQAFNYMNLELVYGECYFCNDRGVEFWKSIVEHYKGRHTAICKGKYWNGKKYGSLYFDVAKDEFNKKE